MRTIPTGLTLLAVLAGSLMATAPSARAEGGTVMGRFNCTPQVPCDLSDAFYGDTEKLFGIANSCVGRNLSASVPDGGFFDSTSGIDDKGCLTTSQTVFAGDNEGRTAPQCCVTTVAPNLCALHCNIVTE